MIAVRRAFAARERSDAAYDELLSAVRAVSAERVYQIAYRFHTVAFLYPQTGYSAYAAFAVGDRTKYGDRRNDIGNVPGIERRSVKRGGVGGNGIIGEGYASAELFKDIAECAVSLKRIRR